jgi:hypothetical protein
MLRTEKKDRGKEVATIAVLAHLADVGKKEYRGDSDDNKKGGLLQYYYSIPGSKNVSIPECPRSSNLSIIGNMMYR